MSDTPKGYMANAQGNLVPESKVKPQDKLEDELVQRLVGSAQAINATMAAFKVSAMDEVRSLRELVASEYGVTKGGAKGNMTLTSFDGLLQVQISMADQISFGPELGAAKALIDECVEAWSEGTNDNLRVLVSHAFQVNKQGHIDTGRVLGLRQLDIDDPTWLRAMDAISDAVKVVSSKAYLRFYSVDPDTGVRHPIPLDLAAL